MGCFIFWYRYFQTAMAYTPPHRCLTIGRESRGRGRERTCRGKSKKKRDRETEKGTTRESNGRVQQRKRMEKGYYFFQCVLWVECCAVLCSEEVHRVATPCCVICTGQMKRFAHAIVRGFLPKYPPSLCTRKVHGKERTRNITCFNKIN